MGNMSAADMLHNLSENWGSQKSFVCYGFGRSSRCEIDYLIDEFDIKYIIDNGIAKRMKEYRSIPIVTFAEYQKLGVPYKIIVLAMSRAETSIKNDLRKAGFKDNEDFCDVVRFITEYNYRFRHKIVLNKLASIVTTRCTLRCKNCLHFMPYYHRQQDINLDELKHGMQKLFEKVDQLVCLQLVGGETLLYPKLTEYVAWLGETYVKTGRMQLIRITSNGTVLPSEDLLNLAKSYPILYEISDYRDQVPVGKKIDEVIQLLDARGIRHYDNQVMDWSDFGFPYADVNMGDSAEALANHMKTCHNHCQILLRDKYWYCVSAGMAVEGGLFPEGEVDSLNVNEATGKQILQYHLGDVPDGYLKLCKHCRGLGSDNPVVVRGGIQLKRK